MYVSQSTIKWPTCSAPKATTLLVRKSMIAGPVLFSRFGNGCKLIAELIIKVNECESKETLTLLHPFVAINVHLIVDNKLLYRDRITYTTLFTKIYLRFIDSFWCE